MSTFGIFYDLNPKNAALVQMEKAFAIDGRRLWMMCPGLFEYLGRIAKWDIEFEFANEICGQILSTFKLHSLMTRGASRWENSNSSVTISQGGMAAPEYISTHQGV
jgi:hypothetical protein